ncbi:MAG: alpha/beta hydrolase [Desulfobacteraceae bacterium]|nr:alpha/beta hydrolase [Desulfobacteraceae bacterium]
MTEFLRIGSTQIEVQWHRQGEKEKPTLVFLHEGLGCADMWRDFPVLLSQRTGCPALVFSRLGYGASDPCPTPWKLNFMHREGLERLPAVIKEAKITDHILIGHSDGGSIGIIYAGSSVAKGLKGLITEAAHVFCEKITVESIYQAKLNYEHHDLRHKLEKYHSKNTENAFRGWNDVWLHPGFIHWNIEKYLPLIEVPVLALQGSRDQYGTVKQMDSIKNRTSRVQTHIIEDCRHSPHAEQSEKVLDIMAGFIDEIIRLNTPKKGRPLDRDK